MSRLWGILIVAGAVAVAVAVMLLIRRGAPPGGYFADSDRASGVFGDETRAVLDDTAPVPCDPAGVAP